jgi:hypothetical protein
MIFDTDRRAKHIVDRIGQTSQIREYGHLPLVCSDTGLTVAAPVRMVYNDREGIVLEIGPYHITTADVAALRQHLGAYLNTADWAQPGNE